MGAKGKPVIVFAFGEKGASYGTAYDRQGKVTREGLNIPQPLAELLFTCNADSWNFTRAGCVAYFSGSPRAMRELDRLVSKAEALRDSRFPTLGIGLAHGQMTGQHNWLGRLKPNF